MHVCIDYPDGTAEAAILKLARGRARNALHQSSPPRRCLTQAQIFDAREEVLNLHLAPALEEYLVQLDARDPVPENVWRRPRALDQLRRESARHDSPGSLRARPRVAERSRFCRSGRCSRSRARCAASPRPAFVRSRGRRCNVGCHHRTFTRACRLAMSAWRPCSDAKNRTTQGAFAARSSRSTCNPCHQHQSATQHNRRHRCRVERTHRNAPACKPICTSAAARVRWSCRNPRIAFSRSRCRLRRIAQLPTGR